MNKKLIIVTIATALVFPMAAFAFPGQPGPVDIFGALDNILNFVWIVFTAFAVLSFLIAGFLFLTANGDPGRVKTAREAVIYGAVGVGVAIIAFSIVGILRNTLGA